MRAEDLHLQNAMLAEDLEAQKEALAATLEDLRATRAELVERARFAMLGELSAGIAHELNNPVAALEGANAHLREDLASVDASAELGEVPAPVPVVAQRFQTQGVEDRRQRFEVRFGDGEESGH